MSAPSGVVASPCVSAWWLRTMAILRGRCSTPALSKRQPVLARGVAGSSGKSCSVTGQRHSVEELRRCAARIAFRNLCMTPMLARGGGALFGCDVER